MKKLFGALALAFAFQFSGFAQDEINYEQIAFDYFVDSILIDNKEVKLNIYFDGNVVDQFSKPRDITRCFDKSNYFDSLWYHSSKEVSPLQTKNIDYDFGSKHISLHYSDKTKLKRDKYIMFIYRATRLNDRIYVMIELVEKYGRLSFNIEFINGKINNSCMVRWA